MGRDGLDAGCGSEGEVVLEGISGFGKSVPLFQLCYSSTKLWVHRWLISNQTRTSTAVPSAAPHNARCMPGCPRSTARGDPRATSKGLTQVSPEQRLLRLLSQCRHGLLSRGWSGLSGWCTWMARDRSHRDALLSKSLPVNARRELQAQKVM